MYPLQDAVPLDACRVVVRGFDAYVELRCSMCNGNAKRNGHFLDGIEGLHDHYHADHLTLLDRDEVVGKSAYRIVPQIEVDQINHGIIRIPFLLVHEPRR